MGLRSKDIDRLPVRDEMIKHLGDVKPHVEKMQINVVTGP